ncbi:MAG: exodeoxyribonuclease VII small subunit [bacterium]
MMTLEKTLERLEAIVHELENDEIDLASALALFEEGVTHLREAAGSLAEAETRVKKLTELAGGAFIIEDLGDDA